MIIVEGPDGAGKTTLVNELQESFGLQVGQRGTKDRDLLWTVTRPDTYKALAEAIRGDQPPVIWDRLYYSELVYHDITGRHCQFSESEQFFIEQVIEAIYPPVIVCLPLWETVRANVAKDHQMEGVVDNALKIYRRYESLKFHGNVIYYSYTRARPNRKWRSLDTIKTIISHYIDTRSYREW